VNSETISMNSETIVHPKLHHLQLATGAMEPMIDWYRKALGMTVVRRTDASKPLSVAWLSNDEANYRLSLIQLPRLSADPARSRHPRLHHLAFQCRTLDDLLGTYARLKRIGIVPALCADGGWQTAFYYEDPDGNGVEINVDNYGDSRTSGEHIRHSPEFVKNPPGLFVDPEKMIVARAVGASPWELHKRAWAGEFNPSKSYDVRVLF
jgi:catechol-2,3-dioxygenase